MPRRQSSAAISSDGLHWFLLNASPDVREQLSWLPHTGDPATLRHTPVEGVLLTDAEIDHSIGIVLLREAGHLPLYLSPGTQRILEDDSRFLTVARAFADMPVTSLPLDAPVDLCYRDGHRSGLAVEAFAVPAGPPRFAPEAPAGHTVGLFLRDQQSGASCAFVPGCGALTPSVLGRLAEADVLLFDGTFWKDDELIALGIASRSAREMDHLPMAGDGGSLEALGRLPCRFRVYTHINNTNPILLEQSPEHAEVVQAGMVIGYDGLHLTVGATA
jgi:pyrroloquinoline quinone biosynthesis protein B